MKTAIVIATLAPPYKVPLMSFVLPPLIKFADRPQQDHHPNNGGEDARLPCPLNPSDQPDPSNTKMVRKVTVGDGEHDSPDERPTPDVENLVDEGRALATGV